MLLDFDLVSASIVFEVDKLRIVWCPLSVVKGQYFNDVLQEDIKNDY